MRKKMCQNSICFMARDHLVDYSAETVSKPLGQKRRAGRPKKISQALIRD